MSLYFGQRLKTPKRTSWWQAAAYVEVVHCWEISLGWVSFQHVFFAVLLLYVIRDILIMFITFSFLCSMS